MVITGFKALSDRTAGSEFCVRGSPPNPHKHDPCRDLLVLQRGAFAGTKKLPPPFLILHARRCFQKHSSLLCVIFMVNGHSFMEVQPEMDSCIEACRTFQRVLKGWSNSVCCAVTFRCSLCGTLHKRHLQKQRWPSERMSVCSCAAC